MSQMSSVVQKAMANLPSSKRGLSVFNQTHTKLTNMEPDYLVPVGCFFVYPNDILDIDLTGIMRLLNLKVPPMAGLSTRFYAFYDRCRNLWDGWDVFAHAYDQQDVDDGLVDPDIVIPHVPVKPALGSIFDYMDAPIREEDGGKVVSNLRLNSLKYRMYNKVWNEWFKKDNIQRKVKVNKGNDGTDLANDFTLLKTNKHLDLFTSCLPWAQKGEAISIGLGTTAPVSMTTQKIKVVGDNDPVMKTAKQWESNIQYNVGGISTQSNFTNKNKKYKEIPTWVIEPTNNTTGSSAGVDPTTTGYANWNTNTAQATFTGGARGPVALEGSIASLQTRYREVIEGTTEEKIEHDKKYGIEMKDATGLAANFGYMSAQRLRIVPSAFEDNDATGSYPIKLTEPEGITTKEKYQNTIAMYNITDGNISPNWSMKQGGEGDVLGRRLLYTGSPLLKTGLYERAKAGTNINTEELKVPIATALSQASQINLDDQAFKYTNNEPMGKITADAINNAGLQADLSDATAQTVNDIRYAVMRQQFAETMARAGSGRYNEVIMALWGIDTGGAEIQRSEYLGSFKVDWNWQEIAQTSESTQESPQGNLTAQGTSVFRRKKIVRKAFSDYGYVLILASTCADISYSQGLSKDDIREDFLDFTNNIFMHSGEQPIFTKELLATGEAENDNVVFGYNEYAARDRYEPSKINGDFRPLKLNGQFVQNLYGWSLTQYFENAPVLSPEFVENNTPIERILAQSINRRCVMMDLCFSIKRMSQMAVYSTPGLTKL